jgi:PKD repeat protein
MKHKKTISREGFITFFKWSLAIFLVTALVGWTGNMLEQDSNSHITKTIVQHQYSYQNTESEAGSHILLNTTMRERDPLKTAYHEARDRGDTQTMRALEAQFRLPTLNGTESAGPVSSGHGGTVGYPGEGPLSDFQDHAPGGGTIEWTTDIHVRSANSTFRESYPAMATASDGTIFVVWENFGSTQPRAYLQIYYSTDGGDSWTAFGWFQNSTYDISQPSLAIGEGTQNSLIIAYIVEAPVPYVEVAVSPLISFGATFVTPTYPTFWEGYAKPNVWTDSYDYSGWFIYLTAEAIVASASNNYNIIFWRSLDYGVTFSPYQIPLGNMDPYEWRDPDGTYGTLGNDIYIASFNVSDNYLYVLISLDYGGTWSDTIQAKLVDILPSHTVDPDIEAATNVNNIMLVCTGGSATDGDVIRQTYSTDAGVTWPNPLWHLEGYTPVNEFAVEMTANEGGGNWHLCYTTQDWWVYFSTRPQDLSGFWQLTPDQVNDINWASAGYTKKGITSNWTTDEPGIAWTDYRDGSPDYDIYFDHNVGGIPVPIADFVGTPTSGYAPLTVQFTDASIGNITSWNWSFPGGTPSTATGVGPHTVIYNSPGTYNVSLTVTGPGGSDTETKTNYITVNTAPGWADFDFNDGTLQGWTLQGAFDESGNGPFSHQFIGLEWWDQCNYPNPPNTDPVGDGQGSALFWTLGWTISMPGGASWCLMQYHSPDLSSSPIWQSADGYTAEIYQQCTAPGQSIYANLYVTVYDNIQGTLRYFFSGTAQTLQYAGWTDFTFNWASSPGFPTDYEIREINIYVWFPVGNNIEGGIWLDDVIHIEGQPPTDVNVDIADDLEGGPGQDVAIPINVLDNLTGLDVFSYQGEITFDPAVLQARSPFASSSGTISSGWGPPTANSPSANTITFGGFGTTPLDGTGPIVYLLFTVVGPVGSSTPLTFQNFLFNAGDPNAVTSNGLFTVVQNTFDISGAIQHFIAGVPLPNATLTLSGGGSGTEVTGPAGTYQFLDLIGNLNYTITPSKSGDIGTFAIGMFDASLIARHVVGSISLDPHQQIAADIDENAAIQMYDAACVAVHVVGNPALPNSHAGEWIFDPVSRNYTPLTSDMTNQDYDAYLLGDVDGNWPADNILLAKNTTSVNLPELVAVSKEELRIPIHISKGELVYSAYFELHYPDRLLEVKQISLTDFSTDFTLIVNDQQAGVIKAGLYGTSPLSEAGIIAEVSCTVTGELGENGTIDLKDFQINNNKPSQASRSFRIQSTNELLITRYELLQNYPNPFNPTTTIKYRLANNQPEQTVLNLFNSAGQLIRTMVEAEQDNGEYTVIWNGLNNSGQEVASGVYFYQLKCGDFIETRKLLKMK